ncbi:lipoxygenase 3, chloroplastic-like protein [Tanacetum coccineum]
MFRASTQYDRGFGTRKLKMHAILAKKVVKAESSFGTLVETSMDGPAGLVFPPVSKLDPLMYGPPESDLKEEHIISHLNGMYVQHLFILDYHDSYLPFLERINAQEDRKAYGTRTVFFSISMGTLKPIAIELSLPPNDSNIPLKQVLTPPIDATTNWLWQLAKAHVCSNDAGVHQLIHHWLRVHAWKYSTKMACAAYRDWWRFDLEGLPKDLIRRYNQYTISRFLDKGMTFLLNKRVENFENPFR